MPRRRIMRHRRRGSVRHHKSPSKFTLIKLMKIGIALGPVSAKAIGAYKANGGGINGLQKGVLPAFSTSYTGYNTNDGKFYPGDMVTGYVPLAGAWIFGKIASRVLRM